MMKINARQYNLLKELNMLVMRTELRDKVLEMNVEGLKYNTTNTAINDKNEEVYVSSNTVLALILQNKF